MEEKKICLSAEDLINKIIELMQDEEEAISGYQYVIDTITCKKIIKKLEEIRDDEKEHLSELRDILLSITSLD